MRFIVIALLLTLTACGFTPMYGSHSASQSNEVQTALNNIQISNIPDYQGQQLRNNLIDRFYHNGRPADPQYMLMITPITINKTDLDLTKTDTATRSQLSVSTTFTLSDKRNGKTLLSRTVSSSASYDILDSRFTTNVSADNAEKNALEDTARQIEQQIVLYFHRP